MRSKSPLALMEQVVMVLVFALAAALCLQVFAYSSQASRHNEAIDRAVLEAQNAAETLKAAGGDMASAQNAAMAQMGGQLSQGIWSVCYDESWNVLPNEESCVYRLMAQGQPAPVEGLAQARVWVCEENGGEELFSLTVAWQEVTGNG